MHSDYEYNSVKDSDIAIITLNEDIEDVRLFEMNAREDCINGIYSELSILLIHGIVITMGGKTQSKFRHGVPPGGNKRRISLAFRHFV